MGVLSFADPSFGPFPTEGRVDAEVVATLKERGVPDDRIVFLVDEQATKANIEVALSAHLRKASPGDLLLLYYAGHGHREPDASTYFIPYDVDAAALPGSAWSISSIFDVITREFRGSTALLMSDACYSGGLAIEAAKRKGTVAFATLCSALENEVSTDAWTFTECIRDALRGRPRIDRDGDSAISLDELGRWVEDEMPFRDGQLAKYARGAGFPADLVLTPRIGRCKPRIGEHVEARLGDAASDEEWQPATIEDVNAGQLLVRRLGDGPADDTWVSASEVRPWAPSMLATGTKVEVLDEGEWYVATVLDAKLGVHFVHYEDFPTTDDEWVGPDKLRMEHGFLGPRRPVVP